MRNAVHLTGSLARIVAASMGVLRNVSIARKLALVVMIPSGAALLLAAVVLILNDTTASRRQIVDELQSNAEIVGANSVAAVTFEDSEAAEQTLSALAIHKQIACACIRTKAGDVLSRYVRDDVTDPPPLPRVG